MMDLAYAQAASRRYSECVQKFRLQHEWMMSLLQGTVAEESLTLLASMVDEAEGWNEEAGWLDLEEAADLFKLQLKLDLYQAPIVSIDQIPEPFRDEYCKMDDQQFKAHLQELRKRGEGACEELSHLRQGLKYVLVEHGLFDDFQAVLEEANPLDAERLEPLLENLIGLWERHYKLALSLLGLADQLPPDESEAA